MRSKTEYSRVYKYPIIWTSNTKHVMEDSGEEITPHQAITRDLIHIKTEKYAELNFNKTKGHIEYVKLYREHPQLRIFPPCEEGAH